jgi:2-polyprenyl-3-methyl-5-hydroxy-6-metoxy-1,4-benzoquinol methylase
MVGDSMNCDKAIILEEIRLSSELQEILDIYIELSNKNKVGTNHTRIEDYRRWEVVNQLLLKSDSHLDIGAGVGQFANLLKKNGANVSACDISKSWRLQNLYGFNYFDHDLRSKLNNKYSTVSCLEVIEHINEGFDEAVHNLKSCVTRQLLLSVPYCERKPLSVGHFQVFTKERLLELFPGCEFYFCLNKERCQWVLIDWRPEKH